METQTTIAVFDPADHMPALRNVQRKKDHIRIRMLHIGAAHTVGITVGIADIIVGKKQDISGSVQQRNVAVDADAPRVRGDHFHRLPVARLHFLPEAVRLIAKHGIAGNVHFLRDRQVLLPHGDADNLYSFHTILRQSADAPRADINTHGPLCSEIVRVGALEIDERCVLLTLARLR